MNTQTLSLLERCKDFLNGTVSSPRALTLHDDLTAAIAAERSKEQAKPLHTSKTYPDDGDSVIVYDGGAGYPDPTPEMLNGDPLFDAIWNAIKYWDISRDNDGMYSSPSGNDVRHIYDAIKQAKPQQEPVAWLVTSEMQDGSRHTYPLSGRYKDVRDSCDFGEPVPLYTSPQQLKSLGDEEILIAWNTGVQYAQPEFKNVIAFARAIEAKLGVGKCMRYA